MECFLYKCLEASFKSHWSDYLINLSNFNKVLLECVCYKYSGSSHGAKVTPSDKTHVVSHAGTS